MIKGYAYIAWQIENHPLIAAEAAEPRYIAQETQRLMAAASTLNPQPSTLK